MVKYSSVLDPREAETWSHSIIKLQSLLHHRFLSRCSSMGFGFVPYFTFSLEVGVLIAFSQPSRCQSKDVHCLLDFGQ